MWKSSSAIALLLLAGCVSSTGPQPESIEALDEPSIDSIADLPAGAYEVPILGLQELRENNIEIRDDGYSFDLSQVLGNNQEYYIGVQVLESTKVSATITEQVDWLVEFVDREGGPGRISICLGDRWGGQGHSPIYIESRLGWNLTGSGKGTGGFAGTYWTTERYQSDYTETREFDADAGEWVDLSYSISGVSSDEIQQGTLRLDIEVDVPHKLFAIPSIPFVCGRGTETSDVPANYFFHAEAQVRSEPDPVVEVGVIQTNFIVGPPDQFDDVTIVIDEMRLPADDVFVTAAAWGADEAGIDITQAYGTLGWYIRSTFHHESPRLEQMHLLMPEPTLTIDGDNWYLEQQY